MRSCLLQLGRLQPIIDVTTSFFKVSKLKNAVQLSECFGSHRVSHATESDIMMDRQQEYFWCIAQNASHPFVRCVNLLVQDHESMHLLQSWDHYLKLRALSKLNVQLFEASGTASRGETRRQPLYSDLFRYANNVGRSNALDSSSPQGLHANLLCNSDIYLNNSFRGLNDATRMFLDNGGLLALTRWESDGTSPLIEDYRGSHDGFVFVPRYTFTAATKRKSRAKHSVMPDSCEQDTESSNFESFCTQVQHQQNRYQAENIVLFELIKALGKDKILNPCYDVKLYHKHNADFRQWLMPHKDSTHGQTARYALCPPTRI